MTLLSETRAYAAAPAAAIEPLIQIRDLIYKVTGIFQADTSPVTPTSLGNRRSE